jgi:DNA-binding transcriptional MocR family regulator
MPQRPAELDEATQVRDDPRHPYQVVAAAVSLRIEAGSLVPGALAPAAPELAVEHGVSLATAKRSLALLQEWGQVVRRDKTALVVAPLASAPEPTRTMPPLPDATTGSTTGNTSGLLCFVLVRRGATLARFSSVADPTNPAELHEMLRGAVERAGGGDLAEYELDVARPSSRDLLLTFVVLGRARS